MEEKIETPFVYWDGYYDGDAKDDDLKKINYSFNNNYRYDDDFNLLPPERVVPEDMNLLIAVYTYESYSGKAFVLYEQDGKLFEVNGSHCSCYGLSEVGWDPEETTWPALLIRDFTDDWFYGDDNPWNKLNDLIAALAAERGFLPKEDQADE